MAFLKRLFGKRDGDDILVAFELNIKLLIEAAGRSVPPLDNLPNRYLKPTAA